MTDEQFAQIMSIGYEQNGIEFKGVGRRGDQPISAKVIRAVIGMANRRNGGIVVLGVEDISGVINPVGLDKEQIASWMHMDDLSSLVNSFAEPPILFDLEKRIFDGKEFVVITVHEFEDAPIICKKPFIMQGSNNNVSQKMILRESAIYVRSLHKPETAEIPSQSEMRALLDLATEKRLQRFLITARAGGIINSANTIQASKELYIKELDGWNSPLIDKIRTRGYWDISIYPQQYQIERIPRILALQRIIENDCIRRLGWNFPYINRRSSIQIGTHWIQHEYEIPHYLEAWRLYQSGHFKDIKAMGVDDWLEYSRFTSAPQGWKWGQAISQEEILFGLTEIHEIAANFCLDEVYNSDTHMCIDIVLNNIDGRILYSANPRKHLYQDYVSSIPSYGLHRTYERDALIVGYKELAINASLEIFHRFDYDAIPEILRSIQEEIWK